VGGDLFEFGDRDGAGDDVRLQHPLGLALDAGRLFIADTYNHKIKVLDTRTRRVSTFAGAGHAGQRDGDRPEFYEPGGLSIARGRIYVADTNNHAVRVIDLATKQTTTLVMRGLEPPTAAGAEANAASDAAGPNAEELKPALQKLGAGDAASLVVDVQLPADYHLNPAAPHRYSVTIESGRERLAIGSEDMTARSGDAAYQLGKTTKALRLPLTIPLRATAAGAAELRVSLTVYYCREDNTGTCRIKTLVWRAPVEVEPASGAPREIRLQGKVE
jgi:hypothetical protein